MTKTIQQPTLKTHHDYLSVNFGGGRVFTLGRSGEKGTNISDLVFNRLCWFVREHCAVKGEGRNYRTAFEDLIAQIDTVWPGWAQVPDFKVGDQVICSACGNRRGQVVKKNRATCDVQFDGDRQPLRVGFSLLQPV